MTHWSQIHWTRIGRDAVQLCKERIQNLDATKVNMQYMRMNHLFKGAALHLLFFWGGGSAPVDYEETVPKSTFLQLAAIQQDLHTIS